MTAYHAGRYDDAVGIWKWLAETGNADASFNLGFMYEFGYGVPVDEAAALTWYLNAAEAGHEQAQRYVAWMFEHGKGTRRNPGAARRWLLAAEAQSDAPEMRAEAKFAQAFFDRLCTEIVDAGGRYDTQQRQDEEVPRILDASGQVT
jgi:TPR repeat protein